MEKTSDSSETHVVQLERLPLPLAQEFRFRKMSKPTSHVSGEQVDFDEIPREWLEEFEAASRRPLKTRFRYAFIKTYKPVMDDAPFRAFDTTADYRRWCEENLPSWLGYGRI